MARAKPTRIELTGELCYGCGVEGDHEACIALAANGGHRCGCGCAVEPWPFEHADPDPELHSGVNPDLEETAADVAAALGLELDAPAPALTVIPEPDPLDNATARDPDCKWCGIQPKGRACALHRRTVIQPVQTAKAQGPW